MNWDVTRLFRLCGIVVSCTEYWHLQVQIILFYKNSVTEFIKNVGNTQRKHNCFLHSGSRIANVSYSFHNRSDIALHNPRHAIFHSWFVLRSSVRFSRWVPLGTSYPKWWCRRPPIGTHSLLFHQSVPTRYSHYMMKKIEFTKRWGFFQFYNCT